MTNDSTGELRTKRVSVWRAISDQLRDEIMRGVIRGGERLPTDIELAQRFGCNKHTARRAVAHLEQEGLVRVEWGRGTFAVEGAITTGNGAQGRLLQTLLDQHRDLQKQILRADKVPAGAAVARGLRVSVNSTCLQLLLLARVGEIPFSLGTSYFPLKRLPGVARMFDSLDTSSLVSVTSLLRSGGVKAPHCARINIGARLPTVEEASHLRMARQQPLLETESVDVDSRGSPVFYARTCFRADRLQLIVPVA